ncbi:MAG: hypothetical protein S4CHLAM102_05760 [Chlamydiia bacterium]|nr:hypothetical protein [Chlamydiia bacterium]
MVNNEKISHAFSKSIFLAEYGEYDDAWKYDDAIQLIHAILSENVGIFRIDICEIRAGKIHFLDDWICDPKEDESNRNFYSRSKKAALFYLEHTCFKGRPDALFILDFTWGPFLIHLDDEGKVELNNMQKSICVGLVALIEEYLEDKETSLEHVVCGLEKGFNECQFTDDQALEKFWGWWGEIEHHFKSGEDAKDVLYKLHRFLLFNLEED